VTGVSRRALLLRHGSFRLLWTGETTSQVGTAVTSVAMPLAAVTALHASAFVVGVLSSAVWLPWLLFGLPAGAWADRLPCRPLLLACDVVSALLLASVPVAAWAGVLTIWQLAAVAMLAGVVAVFFLSALQVFLPSVVQRDDLPEANAGVQASESGARILGPGLGGLLASAFGAVTGLLADAASFAVSAACLLGVRVASPPPPRRERAGLAREVAAGVRYVTRDPYLRSIAAWAASVNASLGALQAVQVVFLIRAVGAGASASGLLVGLAGLGGVAGAAAAARLIGWLGSGRAMVAACCGTAPFALLIPLTSRGPGLALFAAGAAIVEAGIVVCNVVVNTFRQGYCDRALLGRVVASTRTLSYGSGAAGALLGGALASLLGLRAGVAAICAAQLLGAVVLLFSPFRERGDLPEQAVAERLLSTFRPGRPRGVAKMTA
jgi:MFS family permease